MVARSPERTREVMILLSQLFSFLLYYYNIFLLFLPHKLPRLKRRLNQSAFTAIVASFTVAQFDWRGVHFIIMMLMFQTRRRHVE